MRTSKIWARSPDGQWRSISCHEPIWISSSGSTPASQGSDDGSATDRVLVSQIAADHSVCAALLRPDQANITLRINQLHVPVGGLHLLRHGDRVSIDGRELWFSIHTTPDPDRYDPDRHGTPAYCARTKKPLESNDDVIVCGGRPERDCGLLYSVHAWSAVDTPCHECGATKDEAPWAPPLESADPAIDRLLRLVREAGRPAA